MTTTRATNVSIALDDIETVWSAIEARNEHPGLPTVLEALDRIGLAVGHVVEEDVTPLENALSAIVQIGTVLRNALTTASTLADPNSDPVTEYRRLLRAAEKAAESSGGHDRAIALAKIADRWLSDALITAHKKSAGTAAGTAHFGSPA